MSEALNVATGSVPGVYRKVVELRKAVGAIELGNTFQGGGTTYKYRSYKDVYPAVQSAMNELGLVLSGEIRDHAVETLEGQDRDGRPKFTQLVTGVLRVVIRDATDGSFLVMEVPYANTDTSDKAAGKAMSYAMKTCLCTWCLIPTQEDDADSERPDLGKPVQKAAKPVSSWGRKG